MKNLILSLACFVGLALVAGCVDDGPTKKESSQPTAAQDSAKKVEVGKNVTLEIQGDRRRVLVQAYVCLRMGQLEQFLTRKNTKEHEAILAAEVDARDIHTALILAGAEPGKPVQFRPKYQPAKGSVVKVLLAYEDNGKKVELPAAKWIRDTVTKKEFNHQWVFGGSILIPDPLDATKKPFYAANDGDVICVSNFETAMLDLPVESSAAENEHSFEAWTERIPPRDTRVTVILETVNKK